MDPLRNKMDELAERVIDALLLEDATLADRLDGLKTLTAYWEKRNKQGGDETAPKANGWTRARNRIGGGDGETDAA